MDAPTPALTTPEAVLTALPFLLGFHPRESMSVLFLTSGRLALTARISLDDLAIYLQEWLEHTVEQVQADALIAVVTSDTATHTEDALRYATQFLAATEHTNARVLDVVMTDGTWFMSSVSGMRKIPFAPDLRIAEHLAVLTGDPAGDREDVVAKALPEGTPPSQAEYARASNAINALDVDTRFELATQTLAALAEHGERPDSYMIAMYAKLLDDKRVRDFVIWTVIASTEFATPSFAETLLVLARRQAAAYASQAYAVAGVMQYVISGNGALAQALLNSPLSSRSTLATLTLRLIELAVPPTEVARLTRELTREQIIAINA